MSRSFALLLFLAGTILSGAQAGDQPAAASAPAPKQPIAFSHSQHAGTLKLPCKMCHPNPDPGEMMTIAPASTCMNCHSSIKADSPEIQKLAAFAKSGKDVPWVPVYEIPSFVDFSHRTHITQGNTCADCHGPVATRNVLARETDLSMAGCVGCHKLKKARVDCTACHELQN